MPLQRLLPCCRGPPPRAQALHEVRKRVFAWCVRKKAAAVEQNGPRCGSARSVASGGSAASGSIADPSAGATNTCEALPRASWRLRAQAAPHARPQAKVDAGAGGRRVMAGSRRWHTLNRVRLQWPRARGARVPPGRVWRQLHGAPEAAAQRTDGARPPRRQRQRHRASAAALPRQQKGVRGVCVAVAGCIRRCLRTTTCSVGLSASHSTLPQLWLARGYGARGAKA
jgi:hypothetical protein